MLAGLIDKSVRDASKCFPKMVSGVSAAEVKFEQKKLKAKRIFVKAWMEMNSFCKSGRSAGQ